MDFAEALAMILNARRNMTIMQVFSAAAKFGGWHGDIADCPNDILVNGMNEMLKSVNTVIVAEATIEDV